jgi:hypothetical protein
MNTAGWDKVGQFVDSNKADWDRVTAINLCCVPNTCKAVLPIMVGQGYGSVVNLGSDAGPVGSSGEAVHSAAKGRRHRAAFRGDQDRRGQQPVDPDAARSRGRLRGRAHRVGGATASPTARINFAGAAEIVDSCHIRPKTSSLDPRNRS